MVRDASLCGPHCRGYCAAAVACSGRFSAIGIDAEVHERLPAGVIDIVARDRESKWIEAQARDGIHWDRVLFSAKETVYKAWSSIMNVWLGFEDVYVAIDPSSGRFSAYLEIPAAIIRGRSIDTFEGLFLVERNLILTAITLPV